MSSPYADFNRVLLTGELASMPTRLNKPTATGCTFRLHVRDFCLNPLNNLIEQQSKFFNVVTFGTLAKRAARDLRIGTAIAIDGRIEQYVWRDSKGELKRIVDVVAYSFDMFDGASLP